MAKQELRDSAEKVYLDATHPK